MTAPIQAISKIERCSSSAAPRPRTTPGVQHPQPTGQVAVGVPETARATTTEPPQAESAVAHESWTPTGVVEPTACVALPHRLIVAPKGLETNASVDNGEPSDITAPADSEVRASRATVSLQPEDPPLLLVDLPGWSLASASYSDQPFDGLVLVTSEQLLDGPLAMIESAPSPSDLSTGDELKTIDFGGVEARLSQLGETRFLVWTASDGTGIRVTGWQLDEKAMTEIARAVTINQAGRVALTTTPLGFVPADKESAAALGHYVSYTFLSADGQQLLLSFYAGGAYVERAFRTAGDARETIAFNGEEVSLPPSVVGPDDRAEVVKAMLADLPTPARLDIDSLASRELATRREYLASEINQAVACSWLATWIDAAASGDSMGAGQAAGALATATEWAIVAQVDDSEKARSEEIKVIGNRLAIADITVSSQPEALTSAAHASWGCSRFEPNS